MRRLLLLAIGLALVLGGSYVAIRSSVQATLTAHVTQLRRQAIALEHWAWVALAWPAENLTRHNLGGAHPLTTPPAHTRAPGGKGPAHPAAPTTISWNAWLAVP